MRAITSAGKNDPAAAERGCAIVTGASRGFGFAIAQALAAGGWPVLMAARNRERLEHAADEVRARSGIALAQPADVTSEDDVARLVAIATDNYGPIGALVNNAGAAPALKRFSGLTWDEWRRNVDADIRGVFNTCRAVAPLMRTQRAGAIVNIASAAAAVASPLHISYTPAQLAIVAFSRCLANDLGSDVVTVHCLCPSLSPEGQVGLGAARTFAAQGGITVDEWLTRAGPKHPLRAADVGAAVADLVGIKSSGVWHVDGAGLAEWDIVTAPPAAAPAGA